MKKRTPYRTTGTRCGTPEDALAAVRGELDELGSGLNRIAYVDPANRWVYKVNLRDAVCARKGENEHDDEGTDHRHGEGPDFDVNAEEFCRIKEAKRSTSPLKRWVAHTTMFKVRRGRKIVTVLAQPYFSGRVEDYGGMGDDCPKCYDDIPHRKCTSNPKVRRIMDHVKDAAYEFGWTDMHEDNFGITNSGEPRIFDVVGFG